jgi:hypothetical protein
VKIVKNQKELIINSASIFIFKNQTIPKRK